MKASEIRNQFIEYFRELGHRHVPGDSLVPAGDPTLLFTNAGMNQFKDVFLGDGSRDYVRAVNSQKCMRVSGKHNDLEDVGGDTYHHTFFEMLGNWSFGDYYKRDAIEWAWKLLTGVWGIEPERLLPTVFKDDHESAGLWSKIIGIPAERVLRFDAKENFWEMAETGPCGPCSEIHIDMGEKHCGRKGEAGHRCAVNGGCGRYIELWNLVFIQYNKDERGQLHDLPKKHVDTGMGFERLVAILQGVDSNYSTDLFVPIIEALEEIAGKRFSPNAPDASAFRAIADHARALSFAIADGALPSNEGRGYVLRMILRRAVRYGRKLGLQDPFLYRMVPVVAALMSDAYPELRQHREHVSRVILSEEERFHNTLTCGLEMLAGFIKKVKDRRGKAISAGDVFKLYDTYGFPVDLTELVAGEEELKIDKAGFEKLMGEQRERARATWKKLETPQVAKVYRVIKDRVGPTEFCGYETTEVETTVKTLIQKERDIPSLGEGKTAEVVLSRTPFYAEAGGQVGDVGRLYNREMTALISETRSRLPGLITHKVKVLKGTLKVGDNVKAEVDMEKRMETARNHTSTHLLQNALRQVLGEHIKQAGSLVSPERLRFDFTHFTAMSQQEIDRVEEIVNARIREDASVEAYEEDFNEVQKQDIIAIFGEKYGERVRVVDVGGFSRELCGGTHVGSSGKIGLFKIISEGSVAAGVRRIEAVSGEAAFKLFRERDRQVKELAKILKSEPDGVVEKVEGLRKEQKKLKKVAGRANEQDVLGDASKLVKSAVKIKRVSAVIADLKVLPIEGLRNTGDRIKKSLGSGVVLLGSKSKEKALLVCMVTDDLVKEGLNAGKIVNEVAKIIGGSGGGRPHMAQAGGTKTKKLEEALERAQKIIEKFLPS